MFHRQASQTSIMGSNAVTNLRQLADDRGANRQWHLKLINVLNNTQRGYGQSVDRLKQCIDRCHDLEDVRPGATSDLGAANFGAALVDTVRNHGEEELPVDVAQLDTGLEFILIDKAKPGSDILHRISNLKKHRSFACTLRCKSGSLRPQAWD